MVGKEWNGSHGTILTVFMMVDYATVRNIDKGSSTNLLFISKNSVFKSIGFRLRYATFFFFYLWNQWNLDVYATSKSVANIGRAGEDVSKVIWLLEFPSFFSNKSFNFADTATEAFEDSLWNKHVLITVRWWIDIWIELRVVWQFNQCRVVFFRFPILI